MKKALDSRLRSGVMAPEICQGFTTDEVKAALRNINTNEAAGPDKIHPNFLCHFGPVSVSMLSSIYNKSWAKTNVPQECRVADIKPIPKGGRDLQKMVSTARPILCSQ